MSVRTIQYAVKCDDNIVLSENEVGILFIRHSDIEPLRALRDACEQVLYKMEHELNCLQRELKFRKEQEIYRAHLGELVEPRSPIRHITTRFKTYESLFKKLVKKEEEMDQQPGEWDFVLDNIWMKVENLGKFSERQGVIRGPAYMFWKATSWAPPAKGEKVSADVYIAGRLGFLGDASQAYFGRQEDTAATSPQRATITPAPPRDEDRNKPLVWRILNLYMVDDIAGIRVECDYLSDIETLLDALRARYGNEEIHLQYGDEKRDIYLGKIDRAIENPKPGGYRGVHLTVRVKVRDLMPARDKELLSEVLNEQTPEWTLPCEIQIRTGSQQTWSEKSHDLTYKREEDISKNLLEPIRLLGDQLHEADELSDVVRDSIEEEFLPDDFGERRLLNHLRRKLTRDGFAFVEFGLQCAKEKHKGDLRYGGAPHFSHILDICQKMVFRFEVLNPEILFLVAFHDFWMGGKKQAIGADKNMETVCLAFIKMIDDEFDHLIKIFGGRLNLKRVWEKDIPAGSWFWNILYVMTWFWETLRSMKPGEERQREIRRSRILWFANRQPEGRELLDAESSEYGLILEAAILLGHLEDLPDDPNRERRERDFQDFYKEFLWIRHGLPISPIKSKIVHEAEQTFILVARRLGVPIPITQIE